MNFYTNTFYLHFEDCFFATYAYIFGSLNHGHFPSFSVYFQLHIFMSQPCCLLVNLDDVGFCLAGETDDSRMITGLSLIYDNGVNVLQAA